MRLYARFASDLAVTAAERALAEAQVVPGRITHLITVTCTGFDAPGVDLDLIDRLQLPSTTQRINVGFMGCHGAINGLRVARALAADRSDTCVLLSAVELCSLHYRFSWDGEGVIGNALFADGSAALVLASQVAHLPGTRWSGWEVVDTGSVVIAESRDAMSWRVGDHGFEMRLTSDVGDQIEHGLRDWLHDWLAMHGVSPSEIDFWGVHPGGPRILEAVQRSLQLEAEAVETSRRVLAEHGNMSSPTVLFILQDFLRQQASGASSTAARGSHCLLLAFGPGLVAETALLKRGYGAAET